jgi:hypothetical protein
MKRHTRQRLFEVMEKVDPTFKQKDEMDELFDLFKQDPKKKSRLVAAALIDNPTLLDKYKYQLGDMEGVDMVNVLMKYPLLTPFFQPFLNKLTPAEAQTLKKSQDSFYDRFYYK